MEYYIQVSETEAFLAIPWSHWLYAIQYVLVQEDGEYVPQFYEIPFFCDMTAKITALTELREEIAENAEEARAEVLEAEAEAREAQEEAKEAQLEAEEMKAEEDKAFKKLKLQLLEKK